MFNKMNKNIGFYASQDKASKIPRIKPNTLLSTHEESRVCSDRKLPMENRFQRFTSARLSTACSEEESYAELGDSPKRQVLNAIYRQNLKPAVILQTVRENPTNLWCLEKSSEIDADEELEGDLSASPTKESRIITGAGDDPRSATLLKSLALKCKCPSCNNHKHACNDYKHMSANHTDRRMESDSWSSPEVESARKWKTIKHRKFVDASTEDSNLLSDYSGINYSKVKGAGRNNGVSNVTSHVKKSSATSDTARINIPRTASFSFFNVFFDIVFWPFVFFRAKR
ncbi:hypothetical protein DMN91_010444 [Ooceraea biroi]|uniref:Uncharacterized protein n=1 Tax=Ooceraea biroi TaxID=2015173 RepID=A0A3L8D7X8_OOCBI|nr:hypothetical protein DMN91_010444 [Ooceraea biroi]